MKQLIYLILLFPVVVYAGVVDVNKEAVKREFVKACVDGGTGKMPNEKARAAFRDYCECSGEKVAASFTTDELEEINRISKSGEQDGYEKKLFMDKLMKVIKPCLDELRARVANGH